MLTPKIRVCTDICAMTGEGSWQTVYLDDSDQIPADRRQPAVCEIVGGFFMLAGRLAGWQAQISSM